MKLEQLEKIVKANFAITSGWNTDKALDLGQDALYAVFIHFAKNEFPDDKIKSYIGLTDLMFGIHSKAFDKFVKTERFKIKLGLVSNKIKLELGYKDVVNHFEMIRK